MYWRQKNVISKYGNHLLTTTALTVLLYSDFGLARTVDFNSEENLTEYVVTRYYRAPEIMLSSHEVANFIRDAILLNHE